MPQENLPLSSLPKEKKPSLSALISRGKAFFYTLYEKIWMPPEISRHKLPMRVFSTVWRTVEITIDQTIKNNIPIHAAALTYYALMALAPFLMLVLTIFGIVMNVQGDEAVRIMQERLAETIQLIFPEPSETLPVLGTPVDTTAMETLAPQLNEFSGMLLKNTMANSGSTGIIGTLILLVLAVFMIARVEDAYNLIWNVKERRTWRWRFWVYFLFLSIGGALSAVAMSVLSVSAISQKLMQSTNEVSVYFAELPGGHTFLGAMNSMLPLLIAFTIMTFLFACLNRYLPNTKVKWGPALWGASLVSLAFIACWKLASIFVSKISEFNAIYGNLSVIFILMFGLYLAWMFLLVGGQISYAVFTAQNADEYKNINRKWEELSPRAKQEAFFACLFFIFEHDSRKSDESSREPDEPSGITAEELIRAIRIPAALVAECTSTLTSLKLILKNAEGGYNAAGWLYCDTTIADLRRKFDNIREPIELGGNALVRNALKQFSASFEMNPDTTKLTDLLEKKS